MWAFASFSPASRTRHRPLCVRSSPLRLGTGTQTKGNGLKSGGASCHRSFQLPNRTQLCRGEGVQTREGLGQVRDGHDVITRTQAQIAAAEFRAAEILYVPALIFEYLDAGRSQALENLFQFSDLLYFGCHIVNWPHRPCGVKWWKHNVWTPHGCARDHSSWIHVNKGGLDLLKHLEENGEIVDALVQYAATYTAGATDALTAATGGPAAKSLAETRTLQLQTLKSDPKGGHSSRGGSPQAGACREG